MGSGRKQPTCHGARGDETSKSGRLPGLWGTFGLASASPEWQYLQKAYVGDASDTPTGPPAGSKDAKVGPVTHSKAGRDDPAQPPAIVPLPAADEPAPPPPAPSPPPR